MEKPNYEQLTTEEDVDNEVSRHKDTLCSKVKLQQQTEQQQKDSNAAFRETLKYLKEEITFLVEVLDELKRRRKELDGTAMLKVQPIR